MCKSAFSSLRFCLDRAKTWSIRTQLLTFCVASLAVILVLLDCLAVFNLAYLKMRSIDDVRSKARSIESSDMLTYSALIGRVLSIYLESGLMLLGAVQSALTNSLANSITALAPLPSFYYSELPQSCMTDSGGPYPVCIENSSYLPLGVVNSTLLGYTAQLDYILPQLGSISNSGSQLYRLMMYYKQFNFVRVFPGTSLPYDYDPETTEWYQALVENDFQPIATRNYTDSLGAGNSIISLVSPMFSPSGVVIGAFSLDIPLTDLFSSIVNATYRNASSILLVYRDGWTLPNPYFQALNNSVHLNISKIVSDPASVSEIEIGGKSLTAAATVLPFNSSSWWYAVLLVMPEDWYETYSDSEAEDIEHAGVWLITTTVICSVTVLVAVSLCICVYSDRLTAPLTGVVRFAKRLPGAATSRKLDLSHLEGLEEGENNVKELVQSFKKLVRRLVENPCSGPSKATRFSLSQRQFPKNELHGSDRISWRSALRQL